MNHAIHRSHVLRESPFLLFTSSIFLFWIENSNDFTINKLLAYIYIYTLKLIQKSFECFTSNPNAHGTFWNLHIKFNLKIHISKTSGPVNSNFVLLCLWCRLHSRKIIKLLQLIWQFQNSAKLNLCPIKKKLAVEYRVIKFLVKGPLLRWGRDKTLFTSHPTGPGLIPGLGQFTFWSFSGVFKSKVRNF